MGKKIAIIGVFTPEAILKRKIRAHLRKLGFHKSPAGTLLPPSSSKESIRALHFEQRKAALREQREFVRRAFPELQHHFAKGIDIDPEKVEPVLELIDADTWQSDLFRLATLSWSVPVSAGFGRRLRYLVWDKSNNKLMGIIALGDPVFNLKARDDLIGWNVNDRGKRLVNVLDAYVLGAVPPYNIILGGKLISCLVRSREVRDDFARRYGKTRGIISRKKKGARLVIVTTSSSLGRSSVYNRLKLGKESYFTSLGYTQGWGIFTFLIRCSPSSVAICASENTNTSTAIALDKVRIGALGQLEPRSKLLDSNPICFGMVSDGKYFSANSR